MNTVTFLPDHSRIAVEPGTTILVAIRAYKFYRTNENETVDIYTKSLKIDEDIVRNETYVKRVAESNPDPLRKGDT
jgi:NitT/TauT family transport system substrate-binding protein